MMMGRKRVRFNGPFVKLWVPKSRTIFAKREIRVESVNAGVTHDLHRPKGLRSRSR
jgi:hypothetical protein